MSQLEDEIQKLQEELERKKNLLEAKRASEVESDSFPSAPPPRKTLPTKKSMIPTRRFRETPSILGNDILESGLGSALSGSIAEEEDEEEEEEEDEEEEEAAPEKKYSIDDGMPTYELEKTEFQDAYKSRGIYTGTISRKEQLPHGSGRMEYHNKGRVYEGTWNMGHWDGKGMSINAVGDVYEGKFVNDVKEGDGKLLYADGRVLVGRFEKDQAVKGTLDFPDGAKYKGELKGGARHGYGVFTFADGSIYEGQSVMNIFEGKGKMTWTDGGWYEGEWSKGQIHGNGKEVRPDGSLRHDGLWDNGAPVRN